MNLPVHVHSADKALSVEPASAVVAAMVAAAHFWKCQDEKKRVEKEEPHRNVFNVK
jgi:hypothetical protein